MTSPKGRTHCADCGRYFWRKRQHVPMAPMLRDEVWNALAEPSALLCLMCMLRRAGDKLGRRITLGDLRPCPFNLGGQPSMFDVFLKQAEEKIDLKEWEAVRQKLLDDLPRDPS